MKHGWKWILAVVLLAAAGGAAWMFLLPGERQEAQKPSAVEECNQESEFLVPLTAPGKQVIDAPQLELKANGFGCDVYGANGVNYRISGYPDVQDPYHLTEVWVESNACAVYGIRVGDTVDSAAGRLTEWGYEPAEPMIGNLAYRKYDLCIEFHLNASDEVSLIRVAVDCTNEENVEF